MRQLLPDTGIADPWSWPCRAAAFPLPPRSRLPLHAPLDLILVRKIGVPGHRELAMGAVSDGGQTAVVRNEEIIGLAGIDEAEFNAARDRELVEIERRRRCYLGRHHHRYRRTLGHRSR